ncbi:hypothetical protein L484_016210 [Morus notabilis]|uniref:Transmembrane protein n=1 Tax=Morus notabilis TaxID=981085 RepID=W9SLC4_9ROSA|nr:hypothetical protein L484_016210 [Morus notabilis]
MVAQVSWAAVHTANGCGTMAVMEDGSRRRICGMLVVTYESFGASDDARCGMFPVGMWNGDLDPDGITLLLSIFIFSFVVGSYAHFVVIFLRFDCLLCGAMAGLLSLSPPCWRWLLVPFVVFIISLILPPCWCWFMLFSYCVSYVIMEVVSPPFDSINVSHPFIDSMVDGIQLDLILYRVACVPVIWGFVSVNLVNLSTVAVLSDEPYSRSIVMFRVSVFPLCFDTCI